MASRVFVREDLPKIVKIAAWKRQLTPQRIWNDLYDAVKAEKGLDVKHESSAFDLKPIDILECRDLIDYAARLAIKRNGVHYE